MPPQLLALTEGPSILLDKPILLLGRHQECDIQLVSRKVSRRHCCIAQVGEHLVVRDLGSTNGIRINGVRVLEGNLKSGDELTIGTYRYQVRWDVLAQNPLPRAGRATEAPHPPEAAALAPRFGADDDLLESCDQPVPLAEPAGKPPTKLADDSPPPNAPTEDPDRLLHTERAPQSLILPDQIELAPGSSDVFPTAGERPGPPS
jgi:pSer/pThr/pTyr-binding forkhead associated (FHA) protein